MKTVLLTLLFVLGLCDSYAQVSSTGQNNIVYQDLFADLHFSERVPIFYRTSLIELKKFDFKNTDLKHWLRKDNVYGWKNFFNSLNLDTIVDFEFKSPIGLHPIIKKMFIENEQHVTQQSIQLSPVIYSNNQRLALVWVFDWSGPESASKSVYLMELKAGKWRVVQFLVLSIS